MTPNWTRIARSAALLLGMAAWAQQAKAPVDLAHEPHHKQVIAEEQGVQVQVWKVELGAGQRTLAHRHALPFLTVALTENRLNEELGETAYREVSFYEGMVMTGEAGTVHVMENISKEKLEAVTVELGAGRSLQAPNRRPPASRCDDNGCWREEELYRGPGVQVKTNMLDPGMSTDWHGHAERHLVIAITALELKNDVAGTGATAAQLERGGAVAVPAVSKHRLTNTGKQTARWIAVEFESP